MRNTGTTALELDGVRFAAGITHTFAPFSLAAGARLVLAKNLEAFATRYATNNITLVAWNSGNLARGGETLSLVTPASSNILTFTYSKLWYPETFNTGCSLVPVNLTAEEPLWSTAVNWRPSRSPTGTPGLPDSPAFTTVRLTLDQHMVVETAGLEGPAVLWFSDNLETWTLYEGGVWSSDGGTLTINLRDSSLSTGDRGFFQIRLRD